MSNWTWTLSFRIRYLRTETGVWTARRGMYYTECMMMSSWLCRFLALVDCGLCSTGLESSWANGVAAFHFSMLMAARQSMIYWIMDHGYCLRGAMDVRESVL